MKKIIFLSLTVLTTIFITGCSLTPSKNIFNKQNNSQAKIKQSAEISGTVLFSGLKPDPGDKGQIIIEARKYNSNSNFIPVKLVKEPALVDNSTWTWDSAEKNATYDLRAILRIDGQQIAISDIATVTAPAQKITLPLRVTWSKLPTTNRSKSFKKIGGVIKISGYIPDDATINVYTAKARDNSELEPEEVDDPQFKLVVKNVKAVDSRRWYWSEALGQVDYLIKAELYAGNKLIGISDISRGAVPRDDITLNIQSSAVAPVKNVSIEGTTSLRGSYKSDSKIIVEVRKGGKDGFNKIVAFPAESSRLWKFAEAINGQEYNIRAVLQHKGKEIARSKQKHIIAPAKNIKLKIDTGLKLSTPKEIPQLVECKKKGSKKYDAKLTFPGIDHARSYWVKVGTKKHSANRFNEPERPDKTGKDLTIKLRVDKDKNYYAEYSYSYCKDCSTQDSFSDFSSRLKFSCP